MHLLYCGAINRIAFDRVRALRSTLPLVKRFIVSLRFSCPFAFWASSGDLNGAEVSLDAHYACRNSNCWTRFIKDQPDSRCIPLLLPSILLPLRCCLFFAFHGWYLGEGNGKREQGQEQERMGRAARRCSRRCSLYDTRMLLAVHSRSARAHVQCTAITPSKSQFYSTEIDGTRRSGLTY